VKIKVWIRKVKTNTLKRSELNEVLKRNGYKTISKKKCKLSTVLIND